MLDSKSSCVARTEPTWQATDITIPFNGTWFRDQMGIMINDQNFSSKGAAVGKLKEVASWYNHEWVCGEILPHFDMHHIFVASKLRKMLKLAHSLKMGLSANQKWAGSHPTISKSYNKNVKGRKIWTPGNKNGERSQTCGRGSRVFDVRRVRVQR